MMFEFYVLMFVVVIFGVMVGIREDQDDRR
jgi:hypothetical protein